MAESAEDKKFRIQAGVVKRLFKEHKSYIDEALRGEQEISIMKNGPNPDEYKLRKAAECVDESRGMIQDAARRLAAASEELRKAIIATGRGDEDPAIKESKDLIEASRIQVTESHVTARSL